MRKAIDSPRTTVAAIANQIGAFERRRTGKTETFYQSVQDAQYKIQRGLVTRSEAEQLQQRELAGQQFEHDRPVFELGPQPGDGGGQDAAMVELHRLAEGRQGLGFSYCLRAGGAGIPGFYTKTGVGTVIAEGKEHKEFDGETYIMETGLRSDLALVKAWRGDAEGNLVYRKTARNFNPEMATAGKVTVAEVEEIVPVGSLDPNCIHTPGIFVQRIIAGANPNKIEKVTTRPRSA